MSVKKILIASKNRGKIKEISKILERFKNIEILSILDGIKIPEVIEDRKSFEENSLKKAKEIAEFTDMYVIADDSGLCVEALNGEPGIFSARYSGENSTDEKNNEKLLIKLKNISNRKAKFIAAVTICTPEGKSETVTGELFGEILEKPRGDNGFGYDPLFFISKMEKSLAELTSEEKNKISHRANALEKLGVKLENLI